MSKARLASATKTPVLALIITWGMALAAAPPPAPRPVSFGIDTKISVASSGIHDFVEPTFFRSSRDGGATWAPGGTAPVMTPNDFCADPAMAADPAGTFAVVRRQSWRVHRRLQQPGRERRFDRPRLERSAACERGRDLRRARGARSVGPPCHS